jgi:tetratricopeptide (TPR) repeat protein
LVFDDTVRHLAARQRNIWLCGLVAGLVIAASFGTVVWWPRGIVTEQRATIDQVAQADLDDTAVQASRVAADWNDKEAQHALSVSHFDIGEALRAQGYLDDALEAHTESLEMRERLVAADPGNAQWQRDLSVSYEIVGSLLERQGKLSIALIHYRSSRTVASRLAKLIVTPAAPGQTIPAQESAVGPCDLSPLFEKIGGLAFKFILDRDFKFALQCTDDAIAHFSDRLWLQAHRAHALIFLGRDDEARKIYLRYRGASQVLDEKSWDTFVLDDFARMQQTGLSHPLMQEIEGLFTVVTAK